MPCLVKNVVPDVGAQKELYQNFVHAFGDVRVQCGREKDDIKMTGKVSLVLPVHNEADNVEAVIRGFHSEIGSRMPLQIIIAEDGSTDGTKDVLARLSREIPMTVLAQEERLGYMEGLKRGLREATCEYVLFCDSDGQHLPSDFWKMFNEVGDCDMVDGWRVKRADDAFRRVMSWVFQYFAKELFGLSGFHDLTAPYRIVRTEVAKTVAAQVRYMKESFWTEFTIRALETGAKVKEVTVRHRSRLKGKTVVYKPAKIPKIVYNQMEGMLRLELELRRNHDSVRPNPKTMRGLGYSF